MKREKAHIHCVARTADVCGEGPVWDAAHDAIFWTDINRRLVHRLHTVSGETKTWSFDQPVTALAFTSDPGWMLVVLGGKVLLWEPANDRRGDALFTLPTWPAMRMNDAKVDPNGVLWLGTMQNNVLHDGGTAPVTQHLGQLISLDAHGCAREWKSGFGITNTVAWSPAGDALYFGDTLRNTIFRYAFDSATHVLGAGSIFCEGFARGLPDGSAVDADGFLWNCRYGGGCVVRFAPDGSVDSVIDTLVPNPTSCVFAGPELCQLYITSAGEGTQKGGPDDGGLFCMDAGVSGLPSMNFQL